MTITMIIQLLIVLGALWVGSRYGSLALGAISGIGLALLVFGFGLKPGSPPTDVIYIIIAAVTCAGIMQASVGMDWLIQIAEKLLRKHPDRITFLAPLTTFFLTVLVGTGHVVWPVSPHRWASPVHPLPLPLSPSSAFPTQMASTLPYPVC